MTSGTSRRGLLGTVALAVPSLALLEQGWAQFLPIAEARRVRPAGQDAGTPATSNPPVEMIGRAEMPRWTFTVVSYQDPYAQERVTRPEQPEPGTRYVAAEVVIDNASDQPLEFSTSDIRLRDEGGVEYQASTSVVGAEPRLTAQNLPGGERTRGTVWFVVPEGVQITELRFTAPPPQLRVALPVQSTG